MDADPPGGHKSEFKEFTLITGCLLLLLLAGIIMLVVMGVNMRLRA